MVNRHRVLRVDFTNEKLRTKIVLRICNQVYVSTINSVLLSETQLKAAYGHCKALGLGAKELKHCLANREVTKRVGKKCWPVKVCWATGDKQTTWIFKGYGRHITWFKVDFFGVPEQVYRLLERHVDLSPRPVLVHPSVGPGEPLIAFVKKDSRRPTTIDGLRDWWTYGHDELLQWWRLDEEFRKTTGFPGWKLPVWSPPHFTPPKDLTREGIEPNPGWGGNPKQRRPKRQAGGAGVINSSPVKGKRPEPHAKSGSQQAGKGKKRADDVKSKNPRKEYRPVPMKANYDRAVVEATRDSGELADALDDVELDLEQEELVAYVRERAMQVKMPPPPQIPTPPPQPVPVVAAGPGPLATSLLSVRCQDPGCRRVCRHSIPKVWCRKIGSSSSSSSATVQDDLVTIDCESGPKTIPRVGEDMHPIKLGRVLDSKPVTFRSGPSDKAGVPVERISGVGTAGAVRGTSVKTVVYGPRPQVQPVRLVNLPIPPPPPMPIIRWRQSRRFRLRTWDPVMLQCKVVAHCEDAGNCSYICDTRHYGLQWPCFDPIPTPPPLPEPLFKTKEELKEFNREQRELQKRIDEHEAALNSLLGAGRCQVHKVCPQHCSGRVRNRTVIKKRWAAETSVSNWTPFVAMFVFSIMWCALAITLWNTLPDTWWAGILLFVVGPAPNGLAVSVGLIVLRLFAGRAFIQHIYLIRVDQHNFMPSVLVNFNPKDNTVDVRTDHSKVDHMTHSDPFLCDANYVRKLSFDGWAGRSRRGSKGGKHTRTATVLTWVMKLMGLFREECRSHTVSLALLAQLVNANNCSVDADDEVAWQRINQYNRTRGAININQYDQVGKSYIHADTVLFAFATFKDMKRKTAHLPFPASPGLDLLSPTGMATAKSRYQTWSVSSQELSHLPSGTRAL